MHPFKAGKREGNRREEKGKGREKTLRE